MRNHLLFQRTFLAALALVFILLPASARLEGLSSADLDVPGAPPPGPPAVMPEQAVQQAPEPEADKGKSFVDVLQEKERTTLKPKSVQDKSFVDNLQEKERTTLPEPVVDKGKSFTESAMEKSRKKSKSTESTDQTSVFIESAVAGAVARSGANGKQDEGIAARDLGSAQHGDVAVEVTSDEVNSVGTGHSVNTITNIGTVKVGN